MSHKPLIQYLSRIVDGTQNGATLYGTKRKVVKAIHHYKPMPDRVESLLRRANSAMNLSYISALLIEAQSLLICHYLESNDVNGIGGITIAVGDSLATATRTCYPDLLKAVEALTRYDLFDVYEPFSGIDEVEDGGYLKREDVLRILGGDV